ncbi:MAG: CBS domain-containing protein [Chitinophagales bacterium]|nr:CBS domain-containing protein [Chitinophagales bacterium]MDW8418143.1 CBS domain-containing protein [Chitinophagales bacterium]
MASREYRSVSLNTPVSKVMSVRPVVANQFHNLSQVMELFAQFPIHHLPIVDGQERIIGIISSNDLPKTVLRLCNKSEKITMDLEQIDRAVNLTDIMTKNPVTIGPDDNLGDAVKIFAEHKFSSLPVVKDGKLIGILSIKDVVANLAGQL